MKKILVTGASGFIGQRFLEYNKGRYEMTAISLRNTTIQDINLDGYDVILHLAGLAHQLDEKSAHKYDQVNFELTKELSLAAAENKVGQFVHTSTIKVFGDIEGKIDNDTPRNPNGDPYGESKLKAEKFLERIVDKNMAIAIIRPPLVYGPGVKANMLNLMKICAKNIWLPFKGIDNKRTMVFIDNLIEMINTIIDKTSSGIFMAGDADPVSTTKLVRSIRKSMGRSENLISIPNPLRSLLKILKPGLYSRLFMNLEAEVNDSFSRLGYVPPYTTEEGIDTMVKWFLQQNK